MNENCSYCQTKLFSDDRNCPRCGAPIFNGELRTSFNDSDGTDKYIEDYVRKPLGNILLEMEQAELDDYFKEKPKPQSFLDKVMEKIEYTIWNNLMSD